MSKPMVWDDGVLREPNAEEIAQFEKDLVEHEKYLKEQARSARNALLAASDWTQGADIPTTIKSAHKPYRQALRDVPLQEGFPYNIIWPTKPE